MTIVDSFVVIVLMFSSLNIILGGTIFRYANAIETIPGVLLALVAAHISTLIIAMFLGLNNTLSIDFYQWSQQNLTQTTSGINQNDLTPLCSIIATGANGINPVAGFLIPLIPGCTQQTDIIQHIQITPTKVALPNILDTLGSLGGIANLLIQILGLMMLAQIIIRLFFVNLYIILAPIGIACWALPGKAGQPVTRMWLQGFVSTVMVQFVQVVALIVTQILLGAVASHLKNIPGLDTTTLEQILEISVLWFILRIPNLFNTPSMRTISEAGQAMSQAAGAAVAVSAAEIQGAGQIIGGGAGLALAALGM